MNVGLFVLLTSRSPDVGELARKAEDLGFDSMWVPEHMAVPTKIKSLHPRRQADSDYKSGVIPDEYWQVVDPFVALARASSLTSSIQLGISVCLVPEYHPLHLAKLIGSIDHLSGGRFVLGVGTGWLQEEGELMGVDWPHRWTQARECLSAAREVLANESGAWEGRYYSFPPVRMEPKPLNKGFPPVYLGGKPNAIFDRLVKYADGWLAPRMSVTEVAEARETLDSMSRSVGRDPRSINITVFGLPDHTTDAEVVHAFAEAGADRVVPWLKNPGSDEAFDEMETIARIIHDL